MDTVENLLLAYLSKNDGFVRKVLPFLKDEYFVTTETRSIFGIIREFYAKYNKNVTPEVLRIELGNLKHLGEVEFKNSKALINEIETKSLEGITEEWMMNKTENWCKERSLHCAILESIHILDGKSKKNKGQIPELITSALGVCFDSRVGHEYLQDVDKRWEYYTKKDARVPFDIEILNLITNGGLSKKTLNCILAGTNVGKSMVLCHFAASHLSLGKNVLYITMEMREEEIAKRIDGNLLNVRLEELERLSLDEYRKRSAAIRNMTTGKLFIKEYPTGEADVLHFRHLLNELALKKNFIPDIVMIDYINICSSTKVKSKDNSYVLVKSIAEEIRGLAVERELIVLTATQTNRSGTDNSDPSITNTSESMGLAHTLDLFLALVRTDELDANGLLLFKQLKNRYAGRIEYGKFVVGVDFPKMRLFNTEKKSQMPITETKATRDLDELEKQISLATEPVDASLSAPSVVSNEGFSGFKF